MTHRDHRHAHCCYSPKVAKSLGFTDFGPEFIRAGVKSAKWNARPLCLRCESGGGPGSNCRYFMTIDKNAELYICACCQARPEA